MLSCGEGQGPLHGLCEELLDGVVRNFSCHVVVQVYMRCSRNDDELFVSVRDVRIGVERLWERLYCHFLESIFREISAVSFFAVDQHDGGLYLVCPCQ